MLRDSTIVTLLRGLVGCAAPALVLATGLVPQAASAAPAAHRKVDGHTPPADVAAASDPKPAEKAPQAGTPATTRRAEGRGTKDHHAEGRGARANRGNAGAAPGRHEDGRAPAHGKPQKLEVAKGVPKPCLRAAVVIAGSNEEVSLPLAKCDGSLAPFVVEQVSILARPASAQKPAQSVVELAKHHGESLAPGVRRVDPRLVERLAKVAEHFQKANRPLKLTVISGYRPNSAGSYHASARAIDFRVDGVKNTELVAFCKTLDDTGCGFYPNSSFIHMDVRERGAGHVSWIDASGPGESAQYVAAWPPPPAGKRGDGKTEPARVAAAAPPAKPAAAPSEPAEPAAHADPADLPALPAPDPEPAHKPVARGASRGAVVARR